MQIIGFYVFNISFLTTPFNANAHAYAIVCTVTSIYHMEHNEGSALHLELDMLIPTRAHGQLSNLNIRLEGNN